VPYTILRAAVLYGEDDVFVNVLAALLKWGPLFFMPGDGHVTLQPLWVHDLITCLEWSLNDAAGLNQTIEIGGPDFVTLAEMVDLLSEVLGVRRLVVPTRQPLLRAGAQMLGALLPRSPLSPYWLDYLSTSRVCELTSLTRYFGLKPTRFTPATLSYLRRKNWVRELQRLVANPTA
jgi:NADH dehydrogenase